jgi:hypothetical protein
MGAGSVQKQYIQATVAYSSCGGGKGGSRYIPAIKRYGGGGSFGGGGERSVGERGVGEGWVVAGKGRRGMSRGCGS